MSILYFVLAWMGMGLIGFELYRRLFFKMTYRKFFEGADLREALLLIGLCLVLGAGMLVGVICEWNDENGGSDKV